MTLVELKSHRVDAYLARLGVENVRHDAQGLALLQRAHLVSVPFHNLLLLTNDGRPFGLQPLEQVVEEAIAGIGGNCDRTTPPFAALLCALGFNAHLAAATIREPGDHFVSVVEADGRRFVCDVGNGHPYMTPWDLDGPVQEQSFHGWTFRFDPAASGGPTLTRLIGAEMKTVYVLDPAPRAYGDFAAIVSAHYTQTGFGPFLDSLRAVRITPDSVLTLRDGEYARDTRFGRTTRPVVGRQAMRALLVERFGLLEALVDQAVAVVARRRPDLMRSEPQWFGLGRGAIEESQHTPRPSRAEVPDVLVTLASIGRPTALRRLLGTLQEELRASDYPGRVGVMVLQNHPDLEPDIAPEPYDVPVCHIPIDSMRDALEKAVRAGVLPPLGTALPVPIGAAREAQLAAIHAHLQSKMIGLPHPSEHPTVVWMVDDDIAFQQLGDDGDVRRRTNLFFRVARYWSGLPQHSAVIGTLTGDPPVPGFDSLGGQLHDLMANAALMADMGPDAVWTPPRTPAPCVDAYYDLSEVAPSYTSSVWPYAKHLSARPVRAAALALLRDLMRLCDGQQLTRPITWDGSETAPRPSLRRGGNVVFLDLDALFRWPTPVMASGDGVLTRRADTLWAALAGNEDPGAVVEATLPLFHGREGQALDPPSSGGNGSTAVATAAQVRGIVLSRALAAGRPVVAELEKREALVVAQRRDVIRLLEELRAVLVRFAQWGDSEVDLALADGVKVLEVLESQVRASEPLAGDAQELSAFLAQLPRAVQAWRAAW